MPEYTEKSGEAITLSSANVAGIFGSDGLFSASLPGYEHRPQQMEMVELICKAYNERKCAMIEAGTGTGKSLAYLVPSILWSVETGEKVVISTNTINLQEQLINKDIPFLEKHLGIKFKAVIVKGRSNYLCLRKVDQWNRQVAGTLDIGERQASAKLKQWLETPTDGSKSEAPQGISQEFWSKIASQSDVCLKGSCPWQNKCYFYQARKEAEDADLLIVNHHLLFADIAIRREAGLTGSNSSEGGVLPQYRHVVLDEAHNVESIATEYLGYQMDLSELQYLLTTIYRRRTEKDITGLVPAIKKGISFVGLSENAVEAGNIDRTLDEYILPIIERIGTMSLNLFDLLYQLCREWGRAEQGSGRIRLKADVTGSDSWKNIVQPVWGNLYLLVSDLSKALTKIKSDLLSLNEQFPIFDESLLVELDAVQAKTKSMAKVLEFIGLASEEGYVYWIEVTGDSKPIGGQLRAAPLEIAPYFKKEVVDQVDTLVLTSATISVNKNFKFFKNTLGLDLAPDMRLLEGSIDSPFNYRDQALICLPNDLPYPDSNQFTEALTDTVSRLVRETRGRALVLFTSYSMLTQVHQRVSKELEESGLKVLRQGELPRHMLLEELKAGEGVVLLATDSFWEGVDIPGSALSCVVLVKLPFKVPTDPVQEARFEALEKMGKNPFLWYSLPQAVIKFKQGFGRLIRTKSDKGIVVVCDRRILDKTYGRIFLDSLPECPRLAAESSRVCQGVRDWLSA